MANEVRIRASVKDDATRPINGIRDAWRTFQKEGSQGVKAGLTAAAATKGFDLLGSAIHGVTDFIGESIQAASDLGETMSKSRVIFGDAADDIEDFGEQAAESIGLSKNAAIGAAATFGNFFTNIGQSQEAAARMSKELVGLAGDLASFNNLDPTDVLEKLRAGLSGEAEPLRAVGVFLTAAKVQAKAMELGLADAHGELSEGAKILARYHLILDETKTAQGDFARTSDGLANKTRILNAEMENLQAEVGQEAIPVALEWNRVQLEVFKTLGSGIEIYRQSGESVEEYHEDLGRIAGALPSFGNAFRFLWEQATPPEAPKERAHDLAGEVRNLGNKADAAAPDVKSLAREVRSLGDEADDTEQAIDDLAETIADELFGEAITAGNESRLKENIKDLREQRAEARKGSPEWIQLTGEIAENRRELFRLHLEQAEKEGPQAAIDFLRKERQQAGAAKDEIDRLIKKYQALAALQGRLGPILVPIGGGGRYAGKKLPGFAHGGNYPPNEPFIAGEEGPEIVIPGGRGGTVIPNGGSMGGGALTLNVNVIGAALTPAISAQVASQIGPAIADYLKRRALV